MSEPVRLILSRGARRIVDYCKSGGELCLTYKTTKFTNEKQDNFWLYPNGRGVTAVAARAAIDSGFLVSNGDGLFERADPQTWRYLAEAKATSGDLLTGAVA